MKNKNKDLNRKVEKQTQDFLGFLCLLEPN
jgi:hypothetical protein